LNQQTPIDSTLEEAQIAIETIARKILRQQLNLTLVESEVD
jgi:hypothetical protein